MRTITCLGFLSDCEKILAARENVLIKVPQFDGFLDSGEWVYGLIHLNQGFPGDTALSIYRVAEFKEHLGGQFLSGTLKSALLMSEDVQMFCLVALNKAFLAGLRTKKSHEDIALEFASSPETLHEYIKSQSNPTDSSAPGDCLHDSCLSETKTVSMTELRRHFFRIVRAVKEKKTVFTITRRGKPIAKLVP